MGWLKQICSSRDSVAGWIRGRVWVLLVAVPSSLGRDCRRGKMERSWWGRAGKGFWGSRVRSICWIVVGGQVAVAVRFRFVCRRIFGCESRWVCRIEAVRVRVGAEWVCTLRWWVVWECVGVVEWVDSAPVGVDGSCVGCLLVKWKKKKKKETWSTASSSLSGIHVKVFIVLHCAVRSQSVIGHQQRTAAVACRKASQRIHKLTLRTITIYAF